MVIEDLLAKRGMTKYKLAVQAGIPHPTLSDICSGKTKLEKCSAETVYKLSQVLGVSMEQLTEDGIRQTERERAYEYGLPDYLQDDLDAYKSGIKKENETTSLKSISLKDKSSTLSFCALFSSLESFAL